MTLLRWGVCQTILCIWGGRLGQNFDQYCVVRKKQLVGEEKIEEVALKDEK